MKAAIEGWFKMDGDAPALLGLKCGECGTFVFPPTRNDCPSPTCQCTVMEPVELSRIGKVWSYTDCRYAPPPPYVASDPYEPIGLAAVVLEAEQLIVLGQLVASAKVKVGDEVELVIGPLYDDVVVWKWQPVKV